MNYVICSRLYKLSGLILLSSILIGCSSSPDLKSTVDSIDLPGSQFIYNEKRLSEPATMSRYIFTDRYLRIDENNKDSDYILFDRKKNQIYSVVHEEKTVLQLDTSATIPTKEKATAWHIEKNKSAALGRSLNSVEAYHYAYYLNDALCYNVVAVNDIYPDAVKMMRDYRNALARDLVKTAGQSAEDEQCESEINIYSVDKIFENGFPVREWDEKGGYRFLETFRPQVFFNKSLFSIPQDYELIRFTEK